MKNQAAGMSFFAPMMCWASSRTGSGIESVAVRLNVSIRNLTLM